MVWLGSAALDRTERATSPQEALFVEERSPPDFDLRAIGPLGRRGVRDTQPVTGSPPGVEVVDDAVSFLNALGWAPPK